MVDGMILTTMLCSAYNLSILLYIMFVRYVVSFYYFLKETFVKSTIEISIKSFMSFEALNRIEILKNPFN